MIGYVLYPIVGAYAVVRTWQLLPFKKEWKWAVMALYAVLAAAFALTLLGATDSLPMPLASALYVAGNSWLIAMAYLIIIFVVLDALILFKILPAKCYFSSRGYTIAILLILAAILTFGAIHYRHKSRRVIEVESEKIEAPVKLVMLSDLHLGYHNRRATLARWVDMINAEEPDAILIAGDIIDRSVRAVNYDNDAAEFRRLNAPVYACLGNHEYYAGVEEAEAFYKEAGIILLKDSVAVVCGINVIARDDDKNSERLPLAQILQAADTTRYSILLDHQPKYLDVARENKIDFQFSGHTHNGQIWPVSWTLWTDFENPYGLLEEDGFTNYVTSGLGIWGGRFRIGTRSEYVVLELRP